MAASVRIDGLVRLARRVRKDLASPMSPAGLGELRHAVRNGLRITDDALARAGLRLDALPAPTRRAYQFLVGIDFGSVQTSDTAPSSEPPQASVRFDGLSSWLGSTLTRLSQAEDDSRRRSIYESIRRSSESLEREILTGGMRPEQLTTESRAIRGWLAFFAQEEHFAAYVRAVALARKAFEEAAATQSCYRVPMVIHFRPMKGLYRVRGGSDGTLVHLPTPMVSFDEGLFRTLVSHAILKQSSSELILQAMMGPAYQAILAQVEPRDKDSDGPGIHHHLTEVFDRVNAAYFAGAMPRPALEWSRTFTVRKFGHYDCLRDAVMVGSSLDRRDVPPFVVDFIVYHELLHKHLGVRWQNGRKALHTPEFLAQEKRFQQYGEAQGYLAAFAKATST